MDSAMKKAVLQTPGEVVIVQANVPQPLPGEILLQVRNIGICGSDIHIYEGLLPFVTFPVMQGHEMSGVVADANGSARLSNGDKVTIIPRTLCNGCSDCAGVNTNWCSQLQILGVHKDGVAAEYVCVPEYTAVKVPAEMPFDEAAMIEPLAVCVHACNIAGDLKDKNVLVIGAGVIGNLTAQAAKAKGARVMIAGRTSYRLDFARDVGIPLCVNDKDEDLLARVKNEFGEYGADVVFECIGVDSSVNESFYKCRKGGTVVILGIFGEKQLIDVYTLQDKELRVIGSMLYTVPDFEESITLAQTGKVLLKPLITGNFPLTEFAEAYRFIEEKRAPVMKVMIDIQ